MVVSCLGLHWVNDLPVRSACIASSHPERLQRLWELSWFDDILHLRHVQPFASVIHSTFQCLAGLFKL